MRRFVRALGTIAFGLGGVCGIGHVWWRWAVGVGGRRREGSRD